MSTNQIRDNYYELYLQSVMNFAQTVVIKLDQVAQAINVGVIQNTTLAAVDPNDRTTWKYYQNISGTYHFADEPMFVQSLDNSDTFIFSKENLVDYPITKEAYAFGSYYYYELVARYPKQEMLILGILYPCDMQTAIASKDGTILAYPNGLVEAAETIFISNLQDWVYGYIDRWVNQSYAINNDLYVATYVAQLTLNMIPAIMNIRLKACKTNQAHSYHVSQYLRSHGFKDTYIAELNRKQTLDFYRNIRYYQRYAGFNTTFQKLVDLLMTERGFPLYAYDYHQNAWSIDYTLPGVITNIMPVASFVRTPQNRPGQIEKQTPLTLHDVFEIINTQASGNDNYYADNYANTDLALKKSVSSKLGTKILESTLDLAKQTYVQAPEVIVFNEWLNLVSSNVYKYVFEYIPPGATVPIQLTQHQAVALWFYALVQVMRPTNPPNNYVEVTQVPQVGMIGVLKNTLPTKAQLLDVIDVNYFSSTDVDVILSLAVPKPSLIMTPGDFESYCSSVFINNDSMYRYYSFKENPISRAMGQNVVNSLFTSRTGKLDTLTTTNNPYVGMNYISFLNLIGFNQVNYTDSDWVVLMTTLFDQATGVNLNLVADPANIQEAMVNLLRLLSSYSIEIVYTPSTESAIPLNHPDVRVSNLELSEFSDSYLSVANINVLAEVNTEIDSVSYDWETMFPLRAPDFTARPSFDTDVALAIVENFEMVDTVPNVVRTDIALTTSFDPIAQFNALDQATKMKLIQLRA